jgi:hypothetical protein
VLIAADVVLSRNGVPTDTLNVAAGELRGVNFFEPSPWRDPGVVRRVNCGATFLADNIAQDKAAISVRLDTYGTPVEEGTLLEFRTYGQQGDPMCSQAGVSGRAVLRLLRRNCSPPIADPSGKPEEQAEPQTRAGAPAREWSAPPKRLLLGVTTDRQPGQSTPQRMSSVWARHGTG